MINNYRIKTELALILAVSLLTVIGFWPKSAYAESFSVGVNPSVTRIRTSFPKTIQIPITLTNYGETDLNLSLSVKPFMASSEESGIPKLYQDEHEEEFLQKAVKIIENNEEVSQISLGGKETKEIKALIKLSGKEEETDHYFTIIFLQTNLNISEGIQNTHSSVYAGIGTNVLLSISRDEASLSKNDLKVDELSTPFITTQSPVGFKAKIKNEGKHFASIKSYILLQNVFGQTIGKIDLEQKDILAGSSRFISGNAKENQTYWTEPFPLGPYKATLIISDPKEGKVIEKTALFVAIPARTFVLLLVLGAAILLISSRIKKHI